MNSLNLIGRLTRDAEMNGKVAKYSLAVERSFKTDNGPTVDFINCVTFGKNAEFAAKYLKKGMKIAVMGRIQTGSYTNKDGVKIHTTDVIVDSHEFCESKGAKQETSPAKEDFMDLDQDEELPFD